MREYERLAAAPVWAIAGDLVFGSCPFCVEQLSSLSMGLVGGEVFF